MKCLAFYISLGILLAAVSSVKADSNILKLDVSGNPVYVQPGGQVIIDMDALNLAQHVFGCQAILNFSSNYFNTGPGDVDVVAGGGIWNELIYSMWDTGGDLDVAVGVDLESAVGTIADGTVAKFMLIAKNNDGVTRMVFRPDANDIEGTFFSDTLAQAVYPGSRIDSQEIMIDGTKPTLTNLTAKQDQDLGQVDVLNCTNTALQGTVKITVDAADALAGLVGVPTITVIGPQMLIPVLVDDEGPTFGWTADINLWTQDGTYTITITAADKAGNEMTITGEFCVNKNELLINILKLNVAGDPAYIQPGETVVIDMDALNLAQYVFGCQAMLNFSSNYFKIGPGDVSVVAGGGIWNELIYSMWNTGGDMDVAVGVDLESATGTRADGTVAKITLTAADNDGITRMVFRPDVNDIEGTFFSDSLAQAVYPGSRIDSQEIVIDGTPPAVTNLTAVQYQDLGTVDVLNCANAAIQGTVEIAVDAADVLAGLTGIPTIAITGPETLNAVLTDQEGPAFGWTVNIDAATPNGTYTITITAADRAGNDTVITGNLCVNKNEITGMVAMGTRSSASYGFGRNVVFKATNSAGSVLKQWTVTVYFTNTNNIASGSYLIKDVPAAAVSLSAKTNWTLRRKMAVSLDSNGQGVSNFVGDNDLLGGDLNDSNTTNMADYIVLQNNWFTHNAVADINGDGGVQLSDYLILKQNWFKAGNME
jgi:hypothetical protein